MKRQNISFISFLLILCYFNIHTGYLYAKGSHSNNNARLLAPVSWFNQHRELSLLIDELKRIADQQGQTEARLAAMILRILNEMRNPGVTPLESRTQAVHEYSLIGIEQQSDGREKTRLQDKSNERITFLLKQLEEGGHGGHQYKNDYRREYLAYLLGRNRVNTVEIRPLIEEEVRNLEGIGSSKDGFYLTREAESYQIEELVQKDAKKARSAQLVFNTLIGKYDPHLNNQKGILGPGVKEPVPVYFDHDVGFDTTENIKGFVDLYYLNLTRNGWLTDIPEVKFEEYDREEIADTIKLFKEQKESFLELVESAGYSGKEAEAIINFLNDRADNLQMYVEFLFERLTGRTLQGEEITDSILQRQEVEALRRAGSERKTARVPENMSIARADVLGFIPPESGKANLSEQKGATAWRAYIPKIFRRDEAKKRQKLFTKIAEEVKKDRKRNEGKRQLTTMRGFIDFLAPILRKYNDTSLFYEPLFRAFIREQLTALGLISSQQNPFTALLGSELGAVSA
ncbi:MAG: hypothetical protein JW774_01340 [Candidatus Aureabacteria bacterium]|nr:hypothetical protein [Candidatus Auribacterota bacterium]